MRLKQVSAFVENKPGRLAEMLQVLKDAGVNIRALSVADTADFGVIRMILSDTEKGLEVLRGAGVTARSSDVLRVEVPDVPGGLLEHVARPLNDGGVSIEYLYAFVDPAPGKATVVLKADNIEKALRILGG